MNPVTYPQTGHRIHIDRPDWLHTPEGDPRGYIQPKTLKELWFHTGTICNLSCPFCLEGSKPGDDRLNKITLDDVRPFIEEAVSLGVEKFSFTGGEPFVIKDMVRILDRALDFCPCLVLTNATHPLKQRLDEIERLKSKPHQVSFRVSIDHPDEKAHDEGRGEGNFTLSWEVIKELRKRGFSISIARQRKDVEDPDQVDRAYRKYFKFAGLPEDTRIISFPDFLTPGSIAEVPHITEDCMTEYHDEEGRSRFMCSFSKMIVKRNGKMRVYACTLVDDDEDYELGDSLQYTKNIRIMLKHHRCYSCFAQGASCSES